MSPSSRQISHADQRRSSKSDKYEGRRRWRRRLLTNQRPSAISFAPGMRTTATARSYGRLGGLITRRSRLSPCSQWWMSIEPAVSNMYPKALMDLPNFDHSTFIAKHSSSVSRKEYEDWVNFGRGIPWQRTS